MDDGSIEQEAGQHVRRADDDAQQRDVVARDRHPRRRDDVERDRVGERDPVGHRLREEVVARAHPFKAVGMEQGIDQRL